MVLYDIHTHQVTNKKLKDYSVVQILNVSPCELEEKKLAASEDILFSVGIHPWNAAEKTFDVEELKKVAQMSKVVAIGEAGLDKLKGSDIKTQEQIFRLQIELSEKVEKPLIIHCVKAWDELIRLRKEYRPNNRWIIHGFRGNEEQCRQLSALGFSFSIGWLFNEKGLKEIPLKDLFLETDNSGVEILEVYKKVANSLDINVNELTNITDCNVRNAFG